MKGKTPFVDKYIHRDAWYEEIFWSDETDADTATTLAIICASLASYFRGAVKEHLPGGEFFELDSEEVRSVPTHNKFVERMFGYWKQLLVYMPNVSALTAEAFTLFSLNHTYEWLAAKEATERREIIVRARKDVKSLRLKYKKRQAEILDVRRRNLEAERQLKEKREKDRVAGLQKLQKELEKIGGLWTSEEEVDSGLAKLDTPGRSANKVKLDAVKTQIAHRKKVLEQKFPPSLGHFSTGGVAFSLDEMIMKLKYIIKLG